MNPVFTIIGLMSLLVVAVTGLATSPPDSQFDVMAATPADPYGDLPPPEAPQRALPSPETREPAPVGVCPPVYDYALEAGFTSHEAAILDRIAWLESRCDPAAIGDSGQSLGVLQIHAPSWCTPNRWNPVGYLQAALVLNSCEELFDVRVAVNAARAIYLEGGFEQWSTYEAASGG
jgi:hypothetical protein